MPRLDALMRTASDLTGTDPASSHGGWVGEVTAVAAAGVFVKVSGYSPDHVYGPLAYSAPAGAPSVGDACAVVFTDDRDPFVLVAGTGNSWGPWTALAFDASGVWGNSAAPQVPLTYRVSTGGDVQLRGRPVVQAAHSFTLNGTGAVIATLPAGARPAYGITELLSAQDSSIGNTAVSVVIGTPGTITVALENTGRTMGCGAGTAVRLGYLDWSTLA